MQSDPNYIELYKTGELEKRIETLNSIINSCTLCPHKCGIDRTDSSDGYCKTGELPVVASYDAHFGEEPPLTGDNGSGTIFFSNCNLNCIFCQNCDISQMHTGKVINYSELADIMLSLQKSGCHNINLVTPTHLTHAILSSLLIAIPKGLRIPLVYNSGGYDSVEILKLLEGIIDIYMPDVKYMDEKLAFGLSNAKMYPQIVNMAVKEMYRQVGNLICNKEGIAIRGLMIRHLILPGYISDSKKVVDLLQSISPDIYLNIMDQYHPAYKVKSDTILSRRISIEEYYEVINYARNCGMTRVNEPG